MPQVGDTKIHHISKKKLVFGENRRWNLAQEQNGKSSRNNPGDDLSQINEEILVSLHQEDAHEYDEDFYDQDPKYKQLRDEFWRKELDLGKNPSSNKRTEAKIVSLFPPGKRIEHGDNSYIVEYSGKPTPTTGGGEGKTDAYIALRDEDTDEIREIKISSKQHNADFVENKISLTRAEQCFGEQGVKKFDSVLDSFAQQIEEKHNPFAQGKLAVGFRVDLTNKPKGPYCEELPLTIEEKKEAYAGEHLEDKKLHSKVYDKVIENSGAANYMLIGDHDDFEYPEDILDQIVSIDDFVKQDDCKIFMSLGAVNARVDKGAEGSRPLAIGIRYKEDATQPNGISWEVDKTIGLEKKAKEVFMDIPERIRTPYTRKIAK